MFDARDVLNAHVAALVRSFGCYDAVAELLLARWGRSVSKGTIAKKMDGQLDFTLADMVALEDGLGRYPVTRTLARRLQERGAVPGTLIADSSIIAVEAGEAVAAILNAEQSGCGGDRTQALVEVDEAIAALQRARDRLAGEGRSDVEE